MDAAITSASRQIDAHCNRRFYLDASVSVRVFAAESATLLKVKNLDGVRKAIADELKAVFPNDSPFDSTTQTKATAVLTRVRDALKAIK